MRQLRELSGKAVDFHTAVALLDARKRHARVARSCRAASCSARSTSAASRPTCEREKPYDCSASAKAEGLGIALIERIETDDPTSLIGLPLIALTEMLERAGLPVL